MRPKSMILLAVAGLCGLVAAFAATKVMEAKDDGPEEVVMEKIYVAKQDVDLGGLMTEEMVKQEEWPQDKIPDGAVRSLDEIQDRRSLVRLFESEPILTAKLIEKDKWKDATQSIPQGYRVVAVGVDSTSSAANLIQPGHRVDVMVYLKPDRQTEKFLSEPKTATFLRNIKVFSVDDKMNVNPEDEGGGAAKNVSLLVTPTQAQKVSLASALGKIKLSLRREDDDGSSEVAGNVSLRDLLSGTDTSDEGAADEPTADTGGISGFVDDMQASDTDESDDEHEWEMTILSSSGSAVKYVWHDKEKLPVRVGGGFPSVGPAPTGLPPAGTGPALPPEVPLDGQSYGPFDSDLGGGDASADWLNSNPLESLE